MAPRRDHSCGEVRIVLIAGEVYRLPPRVAGCPLELLGSVQLDHRLATCSRDVGARKAYSRTPHCRCCLSACARWLVPMPTRASSVTRQRLARLLIVTPHRIFMPSGRAPDSSSGMVSRTVGLGTESSSYSIKACIAINDVVGAVVYRLGKACRMIALPVRGKPGRWSESHRVCAVPSRYAFCTGPIRIIA